MELENQGDYGQSNQNSQKRNDQLGANKLSNEKNDNNFSDVETGRSSEMNENFNSSTPAEDYDATKDELEEEDMEDENLENKDSEDDMENEDFKENDTQESRINRTDFITKNDNLDNFRI